MKYSIEEENSHENQRHIKHKEAHCICDEEIVLSLFFHVLDVGFGVVEHRLVDHPLQSFLRLLETSDLPLFLFDELNSLENHQSCSVVLVVVVVVQP